MANLIAIDWDSHELRAIAGRTSGSGNVTLTDAVAIPLPSDDLAAVTPALKEWVASLGSAKSKAKLLVAIGRGKAELRQLNLPPVPDSELPALVRFQAMQTLSMASESVAVDYLPVEVSEQSTSVIAGGVSAATIKQIEGLADSVSLELKRVALRPVAAAALHSLKAGDSSIAGDYVLVDLLADDVELVIFRQGKVIFVRSVRMPEQTSGRITQVTGEIRRSLMACGTELSAEMPLRVILWGQAKTHEAEVAHLREALRCSVETLDPLSLVTTDSRSAHLAVGEHTGRLAPLIGLMAADGEAEAAGGQSTRLVDFLNPRKTIEVQTDNRRRIAAGVGIALAASLLAFLAWSSLQAKNALIAQREQELASLRPQVETAEASLARTELVDRFLDGGVLWLEQLRRLADRMPPADRVIVKSMGGASLPIEGGGRLNLQAAAMSPAVVDEMELSLRDETHVVSGTGANDLGDRETYRWGFSQSVTVAPESIRAFRYDAIKRLMEAEADSASPREAAAESDSPPPSDPAESPSPQTAPGSATEPTPASSPDSTPQPVNPSPPTEPAQPTEPPHPSPSSATGASV